MAKYPTDSKYIESRHYTHPRLGEISVRRLSTARRITARWKSADLLLVTVPERTETVYFQQALTQMESRLLEKRPKTRNFTVGWSFRTPEFAFEVTDGASPGYYQRVVDADNHIIRLMMPDDEVPDGSSGFNDWVNKNLDEYARKYAGPILIPRATRMAERLGVSPSKIDISYGQRVLGRCNSRKEILLSRNLVFYPEELRKFVIAHEFAHLTHLNHSERFYRLLDTYLDGEHDRLYRGFKAFKLPFIK